MELASSSEPMGWGEGVPKVSSTLRREFMCTGACSRDAVTRCGG